MKGKSPEYLKAIADGISSVVIETMGFPRGDRYQIISKHEPCCLEYQARSMDRLMMHLVMRAGRADEPKKTLQAGDGESRA